MADGYARAIGTVGGMRATSGPGASNFVTGLYTPQVDSIPLLAITGQNVKAQLGREAFQAVDIAAIVKPVTKKSYCVQEPAMVPWVVPGGVPDRAGRTPRTRPDRSAPGRPERGDRVRSETDPQLPIFQGAADRKQVAKAVEMLADRGKAVLLLGGGVILADACEEFVKIAELLQIPVVTSYMGKRRIPWNHPLAAGGVGIQCNNRSGNQTFLESTLVLAVGARSTTPHRRHQRL